MFNVNWGNIIKDFMSPYPDGKNTFFLSKLFIFGLVSLYDEFTDRRNKVIKRVQYTGQTMSLEKMLNEQYPSANNGIYIENVINSLTASFIYNLVDGQQEDYIHNLSDGEPPVFLFNLSDFIAQVDFIVYVPIGVNYDETKMRLLIDSYRLASKRYEIQTY